MGETYLNPVYDHNFPDPFVLKYRGEYWAYCTGIWDDGRCFGVLRSRDLVHWSAIGGAMDLLPEQHPHYWAPEVVYDNGHFYLYYSVGDEERMQMRVAVADHPAGPFRDSGRPLTTELFAIDGHVFVDDGLRYLFYATDFLDRAQIGTGTVVDRLQDPLTLAGQPRPVALPCYEWHIFDPQRIEKGGVCWHTIEGPFVLKHKGRYYQMFSGGNWKNISYGVSYAMTERIDTTQEWEQAADGERVLPILRTLPGQVVGPGHNSVVRGPDNQQLYCVYHRWAQDGSGRVLSIDPLDWAGERMLVLGPSITPQPAPLSPTFADFFDEERAEGLGPGWRCEGGRWAVRDRAAIQETHAGDAQARCLTGAACCVAELSLRALGDTSAGGYGISVDTGLEFLIRPSEGQVTAHVRWGDYSWKEEQLPLPPEFDPRSDHLLRVEINLWNVRIKLDDAGVRWETSLLGNAGSISLQTRDIAAAFAGFALTAGWEDLFTEGEIDPAGLGWRTEGQRPGPDDYRPPDQPAKFLQPYGWRLHDQQLWHTASAEHAFITKDAPLDAYELVVNVRLDSQSAAHGCYGFYPLVGAFYDFYIDRPATHGPLLTVERDRTSWALVCRDRAATQTFQLPAAFDPFTDQQFRFRKLLGRLAMQWEAHAIGEIDAPREATQVGLYANNAVVAFDMVRVTAITT